MKRNIRDWIPPVLLTILHKFLEQDTTWKGNYKSWGEAKFASLGYNSEFILLKVIESISQLKDGHAYAERDGFVLNNKEFSYHLLTCIFWIASLKTESLAILDFGGSLGTTYYNNKEFLIHLKNLKWYIIEQSNFVNYGKKFNDNDIIQFYFDINEISPNVKFDCVIFNSVLQYLENPNEVLNKIIDRNIPYIFIDLTGFVNKPELDTFLTVQKTKYPGKIISYPCWFFNYNQFQNFFKSNGYREIIAFNSFIGQNLIINNKILADYKGFLFKKEE